MDKQPPNIDTIEDLLGDSVPTLGIKSGSGEYYLPASRIQLLEQLEHLSRYSHFIQIITGVSGSGKTTLLQQFYPNADDSSVHACSIQAPPEMNAAALLAELCQQLNINTDPLSAASSQFQALVDHAELLKQLSRQLLIVIDDAHNLSLDALELLFNQLSTLADDDVRPHIALFADPRIKLLTSAASLSDVVENSCHFIDMPTLDQDELNGLLAHCFSAVAVRLSDLQRQRVYTESLGLPGRVARVLEAISNDRELKAPAVPPAAKQSSRALYVSVAVIVATVLLGSGLWLALPALLKSPSPLQADAPDRVRVELSVKPKDKAEPAAKPNPDIETTASSFEQRLAQARAALEAEQQSLEQPAIEENLDTASANQAPSATASTQQLELAPVKALADSPADNPTDTKAATDGSSDQQPATTLVLELPSAAEQQTGPEIAQEPINPATVEPAQQAPTPIYPGDGQTLVNWKPQGYTLQMLGARRQKSVSDFIASMPESEKLLHFSTIYKGKPWYVVVYGNYASRDAAMTARGELPPQLRSRRPWARSIKGVQDDIRRVAP